MTGPGGWSHRFATQNDLFLELPLLNQVQLHEEVVRRGYEGSLPTLLRELEALDEEGSVRPFGFSTGPGADHPWIYRDEVPFRPWSDHEIFVGGPRRVLYSRWQLLYLLDALEMRRAEVPAQWFAGNGRVYPSEAARAAFEKREAERLGLDHEWRKIVTLLIHIQNRYMPVLRDLARPEVSNPHPPGLAVDDEDTAEIAPRPFDPVDVRDRLELTNDDLKHFHRKLVLVPFSRDPMSHFYALMRMTPYEARERFRGIVRRCHDAYDAAEILRRYFYELSGELLPDADEFGDMDGARRNEDLFRRHRGLTPTPKDLARQLKRNGIYPRDEASS